MSDPKDPTTHARDAADYILCGLSPSAAQRTHAIISVQEAIDSATAELQREIAGLRQTYDIPTAEEEVGQTRQSTISEPDTPRST